MRGPIFSIVPLILVPLALPAADMHVRFARLTLAEGPVEVEQPVTGERIKGECNLPIGQGAWIETDVGGRAEIELDEGSLVRLGPGALAELSDLTRLSTGQRISLVSLERGTLYATGEPAGLDALLIVAPGLEITFLSGARVRVEAGEETSTVAVIEGRVRFSSRAAELDLKQGQTVRVDPRAVDRFQLFREVTAADLDSWNEQRDREAAERGQGTRLAGFPFGLGELDANGKWTEAPELGKVWQPRVAEGWTPFRSGRWRWYDALGYTWVGAEAWGWLPYHYGRWAYVTPGGWVWAPPKDASSDGFHAGAAYWLRGPGLAGCGPLAPGEEWRGGTAPSLYSTANTTFAAYEPGARVVDPGRAPSLPRDPRAAAQFVAALPSPPPLPAISSAHRRKTRVGTTRILPLTADQIYGGQRSEGPETAEQARDGIRIIGAEPPGPGGAPPPAPALTDPPQTYYYYPTPGPESAPLPPEPPPAGVYYPGEYYPGIYLPGVVVIERGRDRHDHPPGAGTGGGGAPSGPDGQGRAGGGQHQPHTTPPPAPPAATHSPAPPPPSHPAPPPAVHPPAPPAPGPQPVTPRSPEGGEDRGRVRNPEGRADTSERRRQ